MSMLFINEDDFQNAMGKTKVMYLATSQNDYVTSRPVSPVHKGMTIYFYTDDYSLKAIQMHANPRVAISFNTYMIEGSVRFLGFPLAPENKEILEIYKKKYGETFEDIENSVVFIAVDITRIRHWIMENGEPVNMAETRY